MSLQACAELVQRGDPERFRAAMAAPPAARAVLFPAYAYALEIARAPWVTEEPLIAEMRLQWWRDALEEIAGGGELRRHEVTTPLGAAFDATGARLLDAMAAARRWDIQREPFADESALWAHLDASSGALFWATGRALGARPEEEHALRSIGRASGLARWFQAVPKLENANRQPLPDGRPETVRRLAFEGLEELRHRRLSAPARQAARAGFAARPLLKLARAEPGRVAGGSLALSEGGSRLALLRAMATGRV